jgi:hypothetical protein
MGGRGQRKKAKQQSCVACSIFTWEGKKWDSFHEKYFEGKLTGSRFESYALITDPCRGGVVCSKCKELMCFDCIIAFSKAISTNHPSLDLPWLVEVQEAASLAGSRDDIVRPLGFLGNCCTMKHKYLESKRKVQPVETPSKAPLLGGATHYYQYDLIIGSTPTHCLDVFALGKCDDYSACTHAVFDVATAMKLELDGILPKEWDVVGEIMMVDIPQLAGLPPPFNKSQYAIKVVEVQMTTT